MPRVDRRWAVETRDGDGPWVPFTTLLSLNNAYRLRDSMWTAADCAGRDIDTRVRDTRTGVVLPDTFNPALEELL